MFTFQHVFGIGLLSLAWFLISIAIVTVADEDKNILWTKIGRTMLVIFLFELIVGCIGGGIYLLST